MVSRLGLRKVMAVIATGAAFAMIAPTMAVAQQTTPGDTTVVADDAAERTTWSWVDDFTSFEASVTAPWGVSWANSTDTQYNPFNAGNIGNFTNQSANDPANRYWFTNGGTKTGTIGYQTVDGVKRGVVGANSVSTHNGGAIVWTAPKAGTVALTLKSDEPRRVAGSGNATFRILVKHGTAALTTIAEVALNNGETPAGWNVPRIIEVQAGDQVYVAAASGIAQSTIYATPTFTYESGSYSFVDGLDIDNPTAGSWTVERETATNTWQTVTTKKTGTDDYGIFFYDTWFGGGIDRKRTSITAAASRDTMAGTIIDNWNDNLGTALTWTAPTAGKITVGMRSNEPYRAASNNGTAITLKLMKNDEVVCEGTIASGATQSADFTNCVDGKGVLDVAANDKVRIVSQAGSGQNNASALHVSPIVSYVTQSTEGYTAKVANVADYRGDQAVNESGAQVGPATKLTAPAAPEGYAFAGWYTDGTLTTPLATTAKTGTAYAKFVKAYSDASDENPTAGGIVQYQGGSLNVDKYKTSDGDVDYAKSDLRFGYITEVPTGATYDQPRSGWLYGTAADAVNHSATVDATKTDDQGHLITNLVFTGVSKSNYNRRVYVAARVAYTTADGTETIAVGEIDGRSVQEVATKIVASNSATQEEKSYAQGILNALQQ
ncbi:hypothetical protein [Bifidobacterium jacchi]|uniref:InlB B-repeat-containing protein n=1 Tax=Bifidobacterium jacchi TaxID=2490545 RepID=A0A5N5RJL2_9BIFI|nr:hypothetical protein [Bifidobacterium jacchi]KAB5607130.1 hypothetical protein EHS19_05570 [Bifidobacterium jacchi]